MVNEPLGYPHCMSDYSELIGYSASCAVGGSLFGYIFLEEAYKTYRTSGNLGGGADSNGMSAGDRALEHETVCGGLGIFCSILAIMGVGGLIVGPYGYIKSRIKHNRLIKIKEELSKTEPLEIKVQESP